MISILGAKETYEHLKIKNYIVEMNLPCKK